MLLLCEGRCNPLMRHVDAVVREQGPLAADYVRNVYGMSRYTEHQPMNAAETLFACCECGHERRCGGDPPVGELFVDKRTAA